MNLLPRKGILASPVVSLLILAGISSPYFINLGVSSLWDANETFYAETPREMLETGNYLSPQFNYEPRTKKPPLTYYAILACYKGFGINLTSARLPGALAATGVICFTFGLGFTLYGRRAGLLAALIVASTTRIVTLARRLPIDILLLFWLTGTAFFMVRAIQNRRKSDWFFAYLSAALGFMTKGPVALVIPAASYLIWALWTKQAKASDSRPLLGSIVMTVVIAPWYVLNYLSSGWTYIASFFLRDNLGRFAFESFGPARSPFIYFPILAIDFFPWSFLALAALLGFYYNEPRRFRALRDLGHGFPLVWSGVVFLLFSLSKNKQEYYIAPIYPLMAVFLAGVLDRLNASAVEEPQIRSLRLWSIVNACIAVFLLAFAAVVPFLLGRFFPDCPALLRYTPAVFLLAGAAAVVKYRAGHEYVRAAVCLASVSVLFMMFAAGYYLPALESYRPVKSFCDAILTRAGPRDEVGYFRTTAPSMIFYLKRPIFEEFDREAMVRRFNSSHRVFCILDNDEYQYFTGRRNLVLFVLDHRATLVTRLRPLLSGGDGSDQSLLLVTNRPDTKS